MAIYLDSAIISEAEEACQWGWVSGITTNPTLLAKSDLAPDVTLQKLKGLTSGEIYYQLTASDFDTMITEGKAAFALLGSQTVLKIPATPMGFRVVACLSEEIVCSVTAIYHPSQAIIAAQAGAKYAIAYVNRATRLLGDGYALVRDMANVLKGSNTEILAASIKSRDEAVSTILAGADHLTLPLSILKSMAMDELSDQTFLEFNQNGKGLLG
jgi:transaldolase